MTDPVPEIVPAANGAPTLRVGDVYLEDATDPEAGASEFGGAVQFKNARLVIVFGAGLGYRIRRLLELGAPRMLVYEPSPAIVALARASDPKAFGTARVVTDFPPFLTELIQDTEVEDTLVLLTPPAYQRAFPRELEALVRTIKEAQILQLVRRNTVMSRSGVIYESTLANFARLRAVPLATSLDRPLAGIPAFIVAAGPSLDKNAHLLEAARKKGVLFAVGTSAPAVVAAGAKIDVLTCIEAIDQSKTLGAAAPSTSVLALDLAANPANFDVGVPRKVVFMSKLPAFLAIARALDTLLLPYGGSVATAAFALARLWGADPIVLVGQDLSYPDGKAYARGTGREHFVSKLVPGGGLLVEDGGFFDSEYKKTGITTTHKARPVIFVPAWGGAGEVPTTHDLLLFARWFESAGYEFASVHTLINATEGGASIRGFAERPFADVLAELPDRISSFEVAMESMAPVAGERFETAREELVESSRALGEAARACAGARSSSARERAHEVLRKAGARAQFAQAYAEPELKRILADRSLSPDVRARRTYQAIEQAARKIQEFAKG